MNSLRKPQNWAFGLSMTLALSIAAYVLGPYIINPLQVQELLQGDIGIHYLGWAFFRYSEWTFPLGQIPDYYYPLGSNIGFTDSIPLMALLLKPFHAILPTDFQYIGPWFLICVGLQAYMAWGLLGELGVKMPWSRAAGTLFLTATPVWFFRLAHPALCAHFLILGSMWMYVKSRDRQQLGKVLRTQYAFLLLVSFVHPYLAVMILGLAWALILKLGFWDKYLKIWASILHLLGSASLLVLAWWITGYFSISEEGRAETGLTDFSTNLNGFFNPMENTSRFLPSLPHNPLQYEGYAYLGIGGLLLVLGAVVLGINNWRRRKRDQEKPSSRMWLLWVMAFLMFVWALSIEVYWGTTRVLRYDLADAIVPTLSAFRTTGRFVWPLYYLILAVSFSYLAQKLPQKLWLSIVLLGLFSLQLYEQWPLWEARKWYRYTRPESFMGISPEKWEPLIAASDKIYIWPPYQMKHVRNRDDYAEIGYMAARNQKPATLGFVARKEKGAEDNFRRQFEEKLNKGDIDPNSLYLFLPQSTRYYDLSFAKMDLLDIDGYIAAISKEAPAPLRQAWQEIIDNHGAEEPLAEGFEDFLKRNEDHTLLIASLDEPTERLNEGSKQYLESKGSKIRSLPFRGSYIGVLRAGKLLYEEVSDGKIIGLEIERGKEWRGITFDKDIRIVSSGILSGYEISIAIDGKEWAEKLRGFTVVVLDEENEVKEVAQFDTYVSSYRWLE